MKPIGRALWGFASYDGGFDLALLALLLWAAHGLGHWGRWT